MKIPFFKHDSPYFAFRWFFLFAVMLAGLLIYANLTGWRILDMSSQEQWSASGSGYHK